MERKFIKKLLFIIIIAAVSIFAVAKVTKAVEPITFDGFSDIGGSTGSSTENNTANNAVNNAVNNENTTSNKVNNTTNTTTANKTTNKSTQSNTTIPQTGSNSIVYFISGFMVLAVISIISISLYNRIKLS